MAGGAIMPPMLRLKRSVQSGSKAMAADWTVVYTESSVMAYIFAGSEIDLFTMAAGDIIDIRVRKVVISGGDWRNHDLVNYIGAMPAGHVTAHISPIPDVYGISIDMRQTAGVLRTIPVEAFDAKRLGLE